MHVDSYLEIFTTMYGWAFANIIGGLLTGLGLVYVPFVLIAFQAWRDVKESAAAGAGGIGISEAVQVKFILAIFVFLMCFATMPGLTLGGHLSYLPLATTSNPNPTEVTAGSTDTSYDKTMPDTTTGTAFNTEGGSLDSVPLWWYFVMAMSSGIDDAIRNGVKNSDTNLRDIEALARNAAIQDPRLNAEIQQFTNECFLPARSHYLNAAQTWNETLTQTGQDIVNPNNAHGYGPSDVDWMGSQLFQSEPGYYSTMHSKTPVHGFALDPVNSVEAKIAAKNVDTTGQSPKAVLPVWRRPTCNEWWAGDGIDAGLRSRMIGNSTAMTELQDKLCNLQAPWSSADACKDMTAKTASPALPPPPVDIEASQGNDAGLATNAGRIVGGAFGMPAVISHAFAWLMTFLHTASALHMLQAVLLMCVYFLIIPLVVMSGFKLEIMWYGGIAIFTIKFWSVLWFIAQWVDGHLWDAMYTGADGTMLLGDLMHLFTGDGLMTPKRLVLDLVLMAMYVGFPTIWSGMMSWIGINVGRVLSQFTSDGQYPGNNKTGMQPPDVVGAVAEGVGKAVAVAAL